jgi:hypothetical protein
LHQRWTLNHFFVAVWSAKEAESTRMNPRKVTIAIVAALSASIAVADDFKTIQGKEYKNVTVSRVEADGLVLKGKSGISKVYFTELPKDAQERFHPTPAKTAAAQPQREREPIKLKGWAAVMANRTAVVIFVAGTIIIAGVVFAIARRHPQ